MATEADSLVELNLGDLVPQVSAGLARRRTLIEEIMQHEDQRFLDYIHATVFLAGGRRACDCEQDTGCEQCTDYV